LTYVKSFFVNGFLIEVMDMTIMTIQIWKNNGFLIEVMDMTIMTIQLWKNNGHAQICLILYMIMPTFVWFFITMQLSLYICACTFFWCLGCSDMFLLASYLWNHDFHFLFCSVIQCYLSDWWWTIARAWRGGTCIIRWRKMLDVRCRRCEVSWILPFKSLIML
jgi:hypothetical protein